MIDASRIAIYDIHLRCYRFLSSLELGPTIDQGSAAGTVVLAVNKSAYIQNK